MRNFITIFLVAGSLSFFSQPSFAQIKSNPNDHYRLGHLLFMQQRYTESTLEYRFALRESIARRDSLTWADLHAIISTNYYIQGKHQLAIDESKKGLRIIGNRAGSDSVLFKLRSNLTISFVYLAKYDSSLLYFQRCEQLISTNPGLEKQIPAYIAGHHNNGGVLYDALGNFQVSRTHLEKALNIARKYNRKYNLNSYVSAFLNNIATQYYDMGNYQKAIDLSEESLKYGLSPTERSIRYLNIGWYLVQLNRYPEALSKLRTAEDTYAKFIAKPTNKRDRRLEVSIPFGLARFFFATENFKQAEDYLFQAMEVVRQDNGPKHTELAKLYIWQGRIREAQHRWMDAIYYYQRAINSVRVGPTLAINVNPSLDSKGRTLSDNLLFEALQRKAHALALCYDGSGQLVDLRFSLETYQVAMELADRIRRGYETSETKLFFQNQVYPTYEQALRVTHRLYKLTHQASFREIGFQIMEKSKASTLADALRDAQVKQNLVSLSDRAKERELNKRITDLRNVLATARTEKDEEIITSQINDKEIELNTLLKNFERDYPQYYQFKYRTETVRLKQIQEEVTDDETALVSYFMGQNDLYTFVVTRESTEFFHRPITPAFRQQLTSFRYQLYQNPGIGVYRGRQASQFCYEWLIQPIEGQLVNKKRLIVVRDTDLHFIPFEALESRNGPNGYLLRRFAIRYAYSGTLLRQTAQQASVRKSNKYDVLGMAPYATLLSKANRFRDKNLDALPASRQEVKSVGGRTFYNEAATKAQFMASYQDYGILHLATHARADEADPARSYIAFFPDQTDHKLTTGELYNLSLNHARLVVLSACETGMGQMHRSEGMLSLSRAFMYAGCPSIVTTLWNAHDQSSAYLSTRLHRYLRKGWAADEALRQAKLDYFDSEQARAFDHPYYWAHFILIGDDAPVYAPIDWSVYAVCLGIGILMFLFGITASRCIIYASKKRAAVQPAAPH